MPFVLDNSVVCGWFLENRATDYSDSIIQRLQEDRAIAPALWELELTDVLRTACLRQKMTAARAREVVAQIFALPIDVDRHAVPPREVLALSLRFGISTCDASYLELALRRQLSVATSDDPLRAAALASGVGIVDAAASK